MKAVKIQKKLKEMWYPSQKHLLKRKVNSITTAKTNASISQTSSECLKLTKEKFTLHEVNFGEAAKISIYNLLSVMLHITPWTLMLMLHVRQSIYLVLIDALSTWFLMLNITFDQISTTLSVQFWQRLMYLIHVLNTCGAVVCLYFGIAFLLFLWT